MKLNIISATTMQIQIKESERGHKATLVVASTCSQGIDQEDKAKPRPPSRLTRDLSTYKLNIMILKLTICFIN